MNTMILSTLPKPIPLTPSSYPSDTISRHTVAEPIRGQNTVPAT